MIRTDPFSGTSHRHDRSTTSRTCRLESRDHKFGSLLLLPAQDGTGEGNGLKVKALEGLADFQHVIDGENDLALDRAHALRHAGVMGPHEHALAVIILTAETGRVEIQRRGQTVPAFDHLLSGKVFEDVAGQAGMSRIKDGFRSCRVKARGMARQGAGDRENVRREAS